MSKSDDTDYKKLRDEMDKINAKLWEKEKAEKEAADKAEKEKEESEKSKNKIDVNRIQKIIKWVIIGIIILIVVIIVIVLIYNLVSKGNNVIRPYRPNEINQNNNLYNMKEFVPPRPKEVIIEKIIEKPVYIERPVQREVPRQLYSDIPVIQKNVQDRQFVPERAEFIKRPVPPPPVKQYSPENRQSIKNYSNSSSTSLNDIFSSSVNNQNYKKTMGGRRNTKK